MPMKYGYRLQRRDQKAAQCPALPFCHYECNGTTQTTKEQCRADQNARCGPVK